MDLIKHDSEHTKYKKNKTNKKKLTNRFINDIGHLIGDKVKTLLKRITKEKAWKLSLENKESITYLVCARTEFDLIE